MKIAIIGSRGYPYVYSGYETLVSELAPRLIAHGHDVTIYCHRALFPSQPTVVNGVKLVYVPCIESKNLSQFTHSFLCTLHVVFTSNDVVLYVNSANGPFGMLTTLFRKKTVINVDGLEWLRPKWKGIASKYFHAASWLSTKLFDRVVSDSQRMAEIYETEFHSSSTIIAYGGNVSYSTNAELISSLGVNSGEYYLIVGRLIPDNNAEIIVRGFEQCGSSRKLVILGDVPYRDTYADRVRQTSDKRIIFAGYVRDADMLRELYCNCYAYIHGHEFGGTNPSLLNALACGNCVLALDTPFSREVLCNGEYGLFFEKDCKTISSLINEIDVKPEIVEVFRAKSRNRIKASYTWERITEQYVTLFKSLMAK